jgi:hypothetical protein
VTVLAIDPGPEQSAFVLWDGVTVREHGKADNDVIRSRCWSRFYAAHRCVIEQIASYGMAVGAEVFATCVWSGRFAEAIDEMRTRGGAPCACDFMLRRDVKLHLCGQARAKDSNIRQALIDRFGGKERAIGRKSAPGPLYGLRSDEWQALALAITFHDLHAPTGRTEAQTA